MCTTYKLRNATIGCTEKLRQPKQVSSLKYVAKGGFQPKKTDKVAVPANIRLKPVLLHQFGYRIYVCIFFPKLN